MANDALTAALLGGGGNAEANPFMLVAAPELHTAQQLQQAGMSTAPAYPAQAIGRLAQALSGTYLQHANVSDLAKAMSGEADSMAGILEQKDPGNILIPALRSPNLATKFMALQTAPKVMTGLGLPSDVGRGTVRATGVGAPNPYPISSEGAAVSDAIAARNAGNAPAATALERGITKETSTPEGVQFPPTPVTPRPQGTGPTPAVAVPPPEGKPNAPQAGPQSMPEQVAGAKANIAAGEKLYGGASEALGKAIGETIEAGGKSARDRMNALNAIDDAITAGGKGVVTGPFAERTLKAREALNAVGINTDWIVKGMPESEVVSKMNAQLASASAKAMTGRPTQFEFSAWMKNNPGLLTSPQGTHALIDILRQATRQDIEIGKLAQNKANWEKWGDTVDEYYKKNPLISPFSNKPMGQEASAAQAAPTHTPAEIAAEMKRRGLLPNAGQ